MAIRRPLIVVAGQVRELGAGDLLLENTVASVAYAATVSLDCATADTFDLTLTGNATVNLTNAFDGQRILLRVKQDATGSRLVTWGTMVRMGTDIASLTLSTAASKLDYIGFIYRAADTKYDLLSFNRGF